MAPSFVSPGQREAVFVEGEFFLACKILVRANFVIPLVVLKFVERALHLDVHIVYSTVELAYSKRHIENHEEYEHKSQQQMLSKKPRAIR